MCSEEQCRPHVLGRCRPCGTCPVTNRRDQNPRRGVCSEEHCRRARVVKGMDSKPIVISRAGSSPAVDAICKVIGGYTECPLQVCQLSRSSESTHFLCLRRYVALFDSTRAPDGFRDRRHVPSIYFLTFPNIKRQPYRTKPIQ